MYFTITFFSAVDNLRIVESACRKSLFSPLNKFSDLHKSSENLGFQWRRTPFLGFPRTPFLTVAENLPLYRQSQGQTGNFLSGPVFFAVLTASAG